MLKRTQFDVKFGRPLRSQLTTSDDLASLGLNYLGIMTITQATCNKDFSTVPDQDSE